MSTSKLARRTLARRDKDAAQRLLMDEYNAWWLDMCHHTEKYEAAVQAALPILSADEAECLTHMWEYQKRMMQTADQEEFYRLEDEADQYSKAMGKQVVGEWVRVLVDAYDGWMGDEDFMRLEHAAGNISDEEYARLCKIAGWPSEGKS